MSSDSPVGPAPARYASDPVTTKVRYYLFQAELGPGMAITDDSAGSRLPPLRSNRWVKELEIDLAKGTSTFSGEEISQAIERTAILPGRRR